MNHYGFRKKAAEHVEQQQRDEGKKTYAYSTIYNGLSWNPITESYFFKAEDETYSYSKSDYERENN